MDERTLDEQATGERTMEFDRLEIAYDERVLTPRPWTAQQSHWAAALIRTAQSGPVLELCSGAGHIGVLAVVLEPRPLVCVDLSPVACEFARRNASGAGVGDLVEVREGRLDAALAPDERFAVVIADPPWVPSGDTGRYPADPLVAIDGGGDGLAVARECLRVAAEHLLPGGDLVLQVGTRDQVRLLAAESAPLTLVEMRDGERGVLAHFRQGERSRVDG